MDAPITRRQIISLVTSVPFFFTDIGYINPQIPTEKIYSDAPWPVFGSNVSNTKKTSKTTGPTHDIVESWSININEFTGERVNVYPSPIVADQTLFIDGNAINIADGSTRWMADWDAFPCYHDGKLITREGASIVARDSRSGDKIYEHEAAGEPVYFFVINDVLYTGPGYNGHEAILTARDAHTGEIKTRISTTDKNEDSDEYKYKIDDVLDQPPVFTEDTAIIPLYRKSHDSIIWRTHPTVINIESKESRAGEPSKYIAVSNDTIFYADDSGTRTTDRVSAHEKISGNKRWGYNIEGEITGPAVTENNIIVGNSEDQTGIICLNSQDGSEKWYSDVGSVVSSPVVVGNIVIVGLKNGEIISVSLEDGSTRWKQDTDLNLHASSIAVGHGRLVVCGKDGGISVFNDVQNVAPEAVIDYEPTTPIVGDTIRFDGLKSDDDHEITSFKWNFTGIEVFEEDGPIAEHKFNSAGEITVNLQVTDEYGKSDETTTTLSISPPHEKPTAEFVYTPSNPHIGETITFDASGSEAHDSSIISYEWDFGDGFIQGGQAAEHTFEESGEYTVTLRIRDDEGLISKQQQVVEINPQRANVQISAATTELQIDEPTTIVYSITNFITSDELTAQLLVELPSEIRIIGVYGADAGSNQFTAVGTVAPGDSKSIRVHFESTAEGSYQIDAIADYYIGDDRSNTERVTKTIQINVTGPEDGTDSNSPERENDNNKQSDNEDDEFGVIERIIEIIL